ncbi:MAG: methyltransferase [Deltaproteobacteria bacterium]|nr:methyltransferase [Deltaproteobacteria bacterium]
MNTQEWNPGRLLEMSGYYWKTCTLHAGVKLDVFTTIGDAHLRIEDIASNLGGDQRGVGMLLNALTAMNLLIKTDDQYSNTDAAKTFLSKNSPRYIGYMIMHHHHLVHSWSQLDQAVKTGHPSGTRASFSDEVVRESFLMGMFNIAMSVAPMVVSVIDLSDRVHLLDLGGGPGTFAIHFCKQNEKLKATVYDLPTTRPFAEKTIDQFGLSDRIGFMDGNYLEENIAGRYDVVWLSHILHGEGPDGCRKIIRKAVEVLEPGGTIFIHDFILNDTMASPLFPALFSLNMLLATPSGQAYSEKQIMDMLDKANVKKIQRLPFVGPTESGIITGVI